MITLEDIALDEAQEMHRYKRRLRDIAQRLCSLRNQTVISESAYIKIYGMLMYDRQRREDESVNRIYNAAKRELES